MKDYVTEQALKFAFIPSVTSQTAFSCLTPEKEKMIASSTQVEVCNLFKAAQLLIGENKGNLSKFLTLLLKS